MSSQSKRTPDPKLEVTPPVTKHKRRKRDDLINRNYTCGCGKSYLSYPALYTHLKQKHNGKQPAGTNLPSTNRGRRPKSQRDEAGNSDNTLNEGGESRTDEKIEEFLEYLGNYAGHMKSEHGIEVKLVQEKSNCSPISFPEGVFKEAEDFIILQENIESLTKDPKCFPQDLDPETHISRLSINKIFSIFLFRLSKLLTEEAYKELCLFMVLFRRTLNKYGWATKGMSNREEKTEFCEENTGDSILQVSNEMITKELKGFVEEFKGENLVLLGDNDEKLMNVVYMTQNFAKWLFSQNYTDFKLDLNYE